MLSDQQEMQKMLDSNVAVDEISKTTWPTPWELTQRELVRVVWKRPQEEFMEYVEYMNVPGAAEPAPNMIVLRPDRTKMVRVATKANWTRDVEIVQEASMSRGITADKDSVTQSSMADRLAGMGEQMLGIGIGSSSGISAAPAPQIAIPQFAQGNIAPLAQAPTPAAAAAAPAVLRTPTKAEKFQEDDDDGDDYAASSGLGSLVKRQPDHVSPVKAVAKIEEQATEPALKGSRVGKAKGKAGAKAKASTKKGRPSEGGYVKLKGGLKNLRECNEATGATWFTTTWTTATSRNWNNWKGSLTNELESCDPSMLEELNEIDRCSKVCIKFLNAYQRHGGGDMQTYQTYLSEMRWLRLGPETLQKIQNPFPLFCREAMFSVSQLHSSPAHFWTQLQSSYMTSQDLPEEIHERLRMQVLNDKFTCIMEGDAVADVEEPVVELLSSFKTSKLDSSVAHILPDMHHVMVIVAEQFQDAALHYDVEEDEAKRLQHIEASLSAKSTLLDNLRVNSLFRMMEKRAQKANKFLADRQAKVAVVQDHVSTGVLTSKDAVAEIEAAT